MAAKQGGGKTAIAVRGGPSGPRPHPPSYFLLQNLWPHLVGRTWSIRAATLFTRPIQLVQLLCCTYADPTVVDSKTMVYCCTYRGTERLPTEGLAGCTPLLASNVSLVVLAALTKYKLLFNLVPPNKGPPGESSTLLCPCRCSTNVHTYPTHTHTFDSGTNHTV